MFKEFKSRNYTLLVDHDFNKYLQRTVQGQIFAIESEENWIPAAKIVLKRFVQRHRESLRQREETRCKKTKAIKCGGIRLHEKTIFEYFKNLGINTLNKPKKPKSRAFHVGVEIEFASQTTQSRIKKLLVEAKLYKNVNLTTDGSVSGERDSDAECNGDCRDNCECYYCSETHVCEDSTECARRDRNTGTRNTWEHREYCRDCTETETLDDCDCGGTQTETDGTETNICLGEHIVCLGHCNGHSCEGSDDHPDYDCNCECDCGGNSDDGHELRVIGSIGKINSIIEKSCEVLNSDSVDAEVNKTCGLHVHLDMRNGNAEKAFQNLVIMQPLLYAMNPVSRFKNTYCKPTQGLDLRTDVERYIGINGTSMKKHKTIEVRIHAGSTNPEKIKNWIALLVAIINAPITLNEAPKTPKQLRELLKLSPELIEYIKERIAKFASEHGKTTTGTVPNGTRLPVKFQNIDVTQAA